MEENTSNTPGSLDYYTLNPSAHRPTSLCATPFSGEKCVHRPNSKNLANYTYAFSLFTETGP